VYTYAPGLGWDAYNLSETIGAFLLAGGLVAIFANLVYSRFRGARAGPDPFHGGTLEWTLPSPPPHYNFAVIPTVSSAYPNWDEDDRRTDARKLELGEMTFESDHETPTSTVRDGVFDEVVDMPSESPWPILVALFAALLLVMVLISHYAVAGFCLIPLLLCVAAWHCQEPEGQHV